jgi:putative transcriptional regulator
MVLPPMKNSLRVLRAEQNWSQAELGMRVGVSRQAINAIETGKYDPGLPLAMRIARAFERKVDDIFELEDNT